MGILSVSNVSAAAKDDIIKNLKDDAVKSSVNIECSYSTRLNNSLTTYYTMKITVKDDGGKTLDSTSHAAGSVKKDGKKSGVVKCKDVLNAIKSNWSLEMDLSCSDETKTFTKCDLLKNQDVSYDVIVPKALITPVAGATDQFTLQFVIRNNNGGAPVSPEYKVKSSDWTLVPSDSVPSQGALKDFQANSETQDNGEILYTVTFKTGQDKVSKAPYWVNINATFCPKDYTLTASCGRYSLTKDNSVAYGVEGNVQANITLNGQEQQQDEENDPTCWSEARGMSWIICQVLDGIGGFLEGAYNDVVVIFLIN
jgi:hypothetical protein